MKSYKNNGCIKIHEFLGDFLDLLNRHGVIHVASFSIELNSEILVMGYRMASDEFIWVLEQPAMILKPSDSTDSPKEKPTKKPKHKLGK
jgi:hypothetical protein